MPPGPFYERGALRPPAERLDPDAARAREQVEEAPPAIRGIRMLNRLSLARSVIGRVADVRGARRIRPWRCPRSPSPGHHLPRASELPAVETVPGERFHKLALLVGKVGQQDVGQDVGRLLQPVEPSRAA